MQRLPLDDGFCVAPQLNPEDLSALAAAGIRSLVCNRPDGEADDQPGSPAMAAAAAAQGLEFAYLPVISGAIGDADVHAFAAALEQLPGPVLAYCRTGTRSATLWALSQAGQRPLDDILARAARAGFDLGQLRPRLQAAASPVRGAASPPMTWW